MSTLETVISTARARVLNRVRAIVADGAPHADAVRRELIIETAGRGADIDNALGDLVKAAMVARDERSEAERAYYVMTVEVLSAARAELGRRSYELALQRAKGGAR